jgi:glycosyltransferase involved in cell wall biosynthesis
MRVLVWQWGRRGAGPRFGLHLAEGLAAQPDVAPTLSFSSQAEIMRDRAAETCDPLVALLPVSTYDGLAGFAQRVLTASSQITSLANRLRPLHADAAVCAMPAPMDFIMSAALRRLSIPYAVVVHDADRHPGDGAPFIAMALQRRLVGGAQGIVALTSHVAERLTQQRLTQGKKLLVAAHPPFLFGPPTAPPGQHGGRLRLLSFGRLLPYKGLGLLADTLRRLGVPADIRVVGSGPESAELQSLRALPGVTVENRWVPEGEIGALLAWADAVVLSHREASQSGVAAAAIAAGRWLVATKVGGLAEQLADEPMALLCEPDAESLATALRRLPNLTPVAPRRDPKKDWQELGKIVKEAVLF